MTARRHERTFPASICCVVDVTALPGDWWTVTGQDAAGLERQAVREVPQGHRLHGLVLEAVAVKRHLKEVIYWLPSEQAWAWVHLTGHVEVDQRWPSCVVAREWDALVADLLD